MVWTLDNGPIILLQNHCVESFQWKLKFAGTKTRSFSDQQAPCQSQMIPTEIQYHALFMELAIGIWHDYRWCFLEISYLFSVSVANLCHTTSLAARRRWQVNPIRWRREWVDNSNHTMLTNTDLATDFMIQTKFELWFGTILIKTYHRTQLAAGKFHTYGHFGWFWWMCNYVRNMPCAQKMPPMKRFHVVVETTNPFNSRWSATAASAGSTLVTELCEF